MGWFRKETYLPPGISLTGPFEQGWALDNHSTREHGKWRRTVIGHRVYRFKYRGHRTSGRWLVKTAIRFLQHLDPPWNIDLILAVPPSRPRRRRTAVEYAAHKMARTLKVPFPIRELDKPYSTRYIKEAISKAQKREIIENTMLIHHPDLIRGKRILLMDDLIKSGTTCTEAVRAIREAEPAWIGFLVWSVASGGKPAAQIEL
jgi:predicted amidophosphoribosyltransferase